MTFRLFAAAALAATTASVPAIADTTDSDAIGGMFDNDGGVEPLGSRTGGDAQGTPTDVEGQTASEGRVKLENADEAEGVGDQTMDELLKAWGLGRYGDYEQCDSTAFVVEETRLLTPDGTYCEQVTVADSSMNRMIEVVGSSCQRDGSETDDVSLSLEKGDDGVRLSAGGDPETIPACR